LAQANLIPGVFCVLLLASTFLTTMQKTLALLLSLVSACYGKRMLTLQSPASAFKAPGSARVATKVSRGVAAKMAPDALKELAEELNPVVGYYDPLNLGSGQFWGQSNDATVGFLRHAEIKHGRVAMAAFVGFCLQSNGYIFGGKLTNDILFSDIAAAGGPPEQWDALPTLSKVQILLAIGALEVWGENAAAFAADGKAHYMRPGGVPGYFPTFNELRNSPDNNFPLNLYDPFGLNAERSREELDKSLLAEINNGRLAQLGIMSLLSASKGLDVPGLNKLDIPQYDGEVMAPFAAGDLELPFVASMLESEPIKDFAIAFPR